MGFPDLSGGPFFMPFQANTGSQAEHLYFRCPAFLLPFSGAWPMNSIRSPPSETVFSNHLITVLEV